MLRRLLGLLLLLLVLGSGAGAWAGERPKITVLAVGYTGSGKGTAARLLVERLRRAGVSASHFSGGDHLRGRSIELARDPENPRHVSGAFGRAIKDIKGKSQIAIAKEALGADLPDVLVIDGPRSPRDVQALRADVPRMIVVALEARPAVRERRVGRRGRDANDVTASVARRDLRDVGRGLEEVMAGADVKIRSEGGLRALDRSLAPLATELVRTLDR